MDYIVIFKRIFYENFVHTISMKHRKIKEHYLKHTHVVDKDYRESNSEVGLHPKEEAKAREVIFAFPSESKTKTKSCSVHSHCDPSSLDTVFIHTVWREVCFDAC